MYYMFKALSDTCVKPSVAVQNVDKIKSSPVKKY